MKPLRLRLQAFGPYKDIAEIDFRDLSLGGLFLIHGQTGAGKTSILDGLCFSLFGKSSGSERSPEGLRCDLASTNLPTEATLEFSLGARTYKITRRPRQAQKKQRGDGLTLAPSRGELYQMISPATALEEADWELISSGDKKTDLKITELLGMNEDQFRQVVVLPQGQFRKFLSANSDEREELLERLFRTEHYRQLSERLQVRSHSILDSIKARKQDLASQLAVTNSLSPDALFENTDLLEERARGLRETSIEFETQLANATKNLDEARIAHRLRQDLNTCLAERARLEDKMSVIDTYKQSLADEKRARPVITIDLLVKALALEVNELETKRVREQTTLTESLRSADEQRILKAKLEAKSTEINESRAMHLRLQETFRRSKELEAEKTAARLLDATVESAQKAVIRSETLVSETRQTLQRLRSDLKEIDRELISLPSLSTRAATLEMRSKQLRSELRALRELAQRQVQARASAIELQKSEDASTKRLQGLKLQYHLSQASLLAKELRHGEPCPVCGGRDHPSPALSTGSGPNEIDLDAANLAHQEIVEKNLAARNRIEALGEEFARSLSTGGFTDLTEAERSLETNELKLQNAIKTVEGLRLIEARQKRLQIEIEKLEPSLEKLEASARLSIDEARAAIDRQTASRARIAQYEKDIPENLRDLNFLTREGQRLRRELDDFDAATKSSDAHLQRALEFAAAARASLESTEYQLNTKRAQLTLQTDHRARAIEQSGFLNLDAVRAAARPAIEVDRLEKSVLEFAREWSGVSARLTDLNEKLKPYPASAFTLEVHEATFTKLRTAKDQRLGEIAALDRDLELHRSTQNRVRALNEELAKLSTDYGVIGKLAGVALGQPPHNLSRVNLARYVLATRLDEVLDQASHRLSLMSRGQFLLRRARAADDKRKNAGLDLEVEDSFTGTRRPTASLSGGESFLASLSLALGLADVVQSRLGGVRLDAVFVDEGFGSLDGEALDLAIKTLADLQAGGRLVGIISHVPELKDQIARKLFVRKTAAGSRVEWEYS